MSNVGMETIINFLPMDGAAQDAFRAAAPEARHIFLPSRHRVVRDGPTPEQLAAATVLLGYPDPAMLQQTPNLKWLQTWSAGVDVYLAPGVLPDGVALTSAVGCYGPAVSEHLLALLMALYKRLPAYRDNQNAGRWKGLGMVKSPRGANVLILGTGDIGSHFALLMKALGANTIGLRRDPTKPADGFDQIHALSNLDQWLPWADVVTLILPHTPETVGLMDEGRLRRMRADAVLLNAGRGTAVDCMALARVLAEGHLWGAGMDVFEPEPLPPAHPLWSQPRALLTPHTAGVFHQMELTLELLRDLFLDNFTRYLTAQPLRNRMR